LRALLVQAFYTPRSERLLMKQLDYNLLFRWFVDLGIDDPVWDVTVFTKNRDRLFGGEIAGKFFAAVLDHAQVEGLLSGDHFPVDSTLIQGWASLKSFWAKETRASRREDRAATASGTPGARRSNEKHRPTTNDDARLFRKGDGQASQLGFISHGMIENRNGLLSMPS
jgi:hypothetical protein